MPRYVALLRGINVGGHRVKMDRLRALFQELPVTNVSTFIASGNVIFDARTKSIAGLERSIATHLEERLGYAVATFIRTVDELEAVADRPTPADDAARSTYVIFLSTEAAPETVETLTALQSETDRFEFAGREIYWRIRGTMSASPLFGGGFEKAMKPVPNTARNMTSLVKLVRRLR